MTVNTTSQQLRLINVYSTSNIGDAAIYASFSEMAQAFDVYWPDNQTELKQHLADAVLPMQDETSMDVNLSVGGDIFNNPATTTAGFKPHRPVWTIHTALMSWTQFQIIVNDLETSGGGNRQRC